MRPNRGDEEASRLLGKLLDKVEAIAVEDRSRRVTERLPRTSWLSDERDALYARLAAAEECGAVELEWGKRENSHNIERVVLRDASGLYRFMGRVPLDDRVSAVQERVRQILADAGITPPLLLSCLLDDLASGWRDGKQLVRGLVPEDPDKVATCLMVMNALLQMEGDAASDGIDIRTFSRRTTGDSKFVERHQAQIATMLKLTGQVSGDLKAEEALNARGITRFPHPCLIGGSLTYEGRPLPAVPYIGISPEMAPLVRIDRQPEWMLTVENLASFNRQVREVGEGGLVVYTGGFPSDLTLQTILHLAGQGDFPVFHWGDIDVGGVRIAYRLERALGNAGRGLGLHLMTPEIARSRGQPAPPEKVFERPDPDSVTFQIASFLNSPEAHHLEQEELDPSIPASASGTVRGLAAAG